MGLNFIDTPPLIVPHAAHEMVSLGPIHPPHTHRSPDTVCPCINFGCFGLLICLRNHPIIQVTGVPQLPIRSAQQCKLVTEHIRLLCLPMPGSCLMARGHRARVPTRTRQMPSSRSQHCPNSLTQVAVVHDKDRHKIGSNTTYSA